jgi:hypothetical protein
MNDVIDGGATLGGLLLGFIAAVITRAWIDSAVLSLLVLALTWLWALSLSAGPSQRS